MSEFVRIPTATVLSGERGGESQKEVQAKPLVTR